MKKLLSTDYKRLTRNLIISLTFLIIASLLFWTVRWGLQEYRTTSYTNTFYDAIEKNLSRGNHTQITTQAGKTIYGAQGVLTKTDYISFNGAPLISEKYLATSNTIITGDYIRLLTLENTYSRYLKTSNSNETKSIEIPDDLQALWAVRPGNSVTPILYQEIPAANLKKSDAQRIAAFMKKNNSYDLDLENAHIKKEGGKTILHLGIKTNPVSLAGSLQELNKTTGYLKDTLAKPETAKSTPYLIMNVAIDTATKKIVYIDYPGQNKTNQGVSKQEFNDYQLSQVPTVPTSAIPFDELGARIKAALGIN